MKSLLFSALAALILPHVAHAGNEGPPPSPQPPPPVRTPLVKCLPRASGLFGFELAKVSGCAIQPGGPRCGDRIDMAVLGFDPSLRDWVYAGGALGYPDTAVADKATGQFLYQYASGDGQHISVSVKGAASVVDIKLGVGFELVPAVDTKGPQTSFNCQLE